MRCFTGFESDGSGAVTTVHTSAGDIQADQVVVAVGPWIASAWEMLGLPDRLDVRQPDGQVVTDQPMWTYWYLQEGEAAFDPALFVTNDGTSSPVLHVDSDQPLHADDGTLITDVFWGVYFKPDRDSVQGGAQPIRLGNTFAVVPTPPAPLTPASRTCGPPPSLTASSASRAPAASTARCAPAVSAPSPSTTSRCSTTCAPTCSSPRTPTTATR